MAYVVYRVNEADGAIVAAQFVQKYERYASWKNMGEEPTLGAALALLESLGLTLTEGLHVDLMQLSLEDYESVARCIGKIMGVDPGQCVQQLYETMIQENLITVQ